ncbi:DNRLRE domain-containing protein [Vibrio paucivorans]|uniref:DNRLRE domain-containing protein n=1 Tax=Vibrio paucivorans TaxID=2829489 RepID=A0A9X3CGN5_9VIBR|nr:DNRLRE domain-containing protein [Vibrio paucivorans]MCW8335437.1 DNRLRE domain-containing protein [Vibrio paucivorans]
MMSYKKLSKIFAATLISAAIVGCGGEESPGSSSSGESSIQAPIVQDHVGQVLLRDDYKQVSLKDNVSDPQNLPVTLESVVSVSEQCSDPQFDSESLTFFVDKNEPSVCYYEYTVKNHSQTPELDKSAKAESFVLVTEEEVEVTLPPLSKTMVVNDTLVIDLERELEQAFPAGFQVNDTVVVLGDGTAFSDSCDNTITYNSLAQGVTRLIYSLSDESTDITAGYIDIAVSVEGNHQPQAENFEFAGEATMHSEVVIDVADYISDPDPDDVLQLVDVQAYDATVSIEANSPLDNTAFNFQADVPGVYDVTYTITDHRGGWATGIASITVGKPWDSVLLSNGLFFSDMFIEEEAGAAIYERYAIETINGSEFKLPLMTQFQALMYCSSQKMTLATEKQLQALRSEGGSELETWPTSRPYWVSDVGLAFDLSSGESVSALDLGYVSCFAIEQTADTYVDSEHKDTNYGDAHRVNIKEAEFSLSKRRAYYQLDGDALSGASSIHAVLTGEYAVDGEEIPENESLVVYLTDNDWDEYSLTYNTQPSVIEEVGRYPLQLDDNGNGGPRDYVIDLTEKLAPYLDGNDLSLLVKMNGQDGADSQGHVNVNLRESGDNDLHFTVGTQAIGHLEITPDSFSIVVSNAEAGSAQLEASVVYPDGTRLDVTDTAEWASSDDEIATVDDGLVTARGEGEVHITASYGGDTAVSNGIITIEGVVAVSLEIIDMPKTVYVGQWLKPSTRVTYSDGSTQVIPIGHPDMTWISSNEEILSVQDDYVLIEAEGDTTLSAKLTPDAGAPFHPATSVDVTAIESVNGSESFQGERCVDIDLGGNVRLCQVLNTTGTSNPSHACGALGFDMDAQPYAYHLINNPQAFSNFVTYHLPYMADGLYSFGFFQYPFNFNIYLSYVGYDTVTVQPDTVGIHDRTPTHINNVSELGDDQFILICAKAIDTTP